MPTDNSVQTTQQIATASRHIICISTFMLLARLASAATGIVSSRACSREVVRSVLWNVLNEAFAVICGQWRVSLNDKTAAATA
jgi:hypothetical protein